MRNVRKPDVEFLVIGGGFYGCSLALFLRSISDSIAIVEAADTLLSRASRVNQARIHTGFHYPRSALTAVKSMLLHQRFVENFPEAVVDNFQMLYAIAQRRSNVSSRRFYRMFENMNAPIKPATPSQAALFDPDLIEDVFACTEYAFDFSSLRRTMSSQLDKVDLQPRLNTRVEDLEETGDGVIVRLSTGEELLAGHVFNVTYAGINTLLRKANRPVASLKYEITEIALVRPPEPLSGYGVTVMDGPFFSVMPYPAEALYSLTHVRYTPHHSWKYGTNDADPYAILERLPLQTRQRFMIKDSGRFLPCLEEAEWVKSIYDVKTVLLKNENDDGRPILYQRRPKDSRIISILGGKIDNIYDLFELVRMTNQEWQKADDRFVYALSDSTATFAS